MKKLFLALALFCSVALISHSYPPDGYTCYAFYFNVKNYQGQHLFNATATVSDMSYLDMTTSNLTPDSTGYINLFFLVPVDPDLPTPTVDGIQVTFSAPGYQDAVYYLDNHHIISIIMAGS